VQRRRPQARRVRPEHGPLADPVRRTTPVRTLEMSQLKTEPKKAPAPAGPPTASKDGSISAFGKARATVSGSPLSPDEVRTLDAFWRACNYLALGMTSLKANPLLKEPLKPEHIKDRLLGHWGASPGLAFCYIHLSRAIKVHDLNVVYMAGPGHGAP